MAIKPFNVLVGAPTTKVIITSTERKTTLSATLGDTEPQLLSVSTNKTLNQPSGSFQISLTPEKDANGLTWFDKVNVWDFVEIYFKGILDKSEVTVMRGLIDSIAYSESFGSGAPQRNITLSGRDLGCLLTDFQIYIIPELGPKAAAMAELGGPIWFKAVQEEFLYGNSYEIFKWLAEILFTEIDLQISTEEREHITTYFAWDAASFFPDMQTSMSFLASWQGTWWNTFSQIQDQPFHELFIYDADELSYFIMRPTRLKDCYGNYHESVDSLIKDKSKSHMYPPDFKITNAEKISMSLSKSINDMRNFYLSFPTVNIIAKQEFRGVAIQENADNPANSINPYFQLKEEFPSYMKKYGFRKYEFETVYLDLDIGQRKHQGVNFYDQTKDVFVEAGKKLNSVLISWYLHNPLLLTGTVEIAGTNRAIVGTYMLDEDEDKEYYVEGVSHSFTTLQSFTTGLTLSRGMPSKGLPGVNPKSFERKSSYEERG